MSEAEAGLERGENSREGERMKAASDDDGDDEARREEEERERENEAVRDSGSTDESQGNWGNEGGERSE